MRLDSGEVRHGVVLDVSETLAVVEVYEGTAGIASRRREDRLHRQPAADPRRRGLARTRLQRPRRAARRRAARSSATSSAASPAARSTRARGRRRGTPILTGVSAIDGLATLVRGQKLPIFSVGGLPHLELAAQMAAQAQTGDEPFAVVFAAVGITHADAMAVRDALEERAAAGDLTLFLNTADDPLVERIITPRIALTVAEHLAFDLGRHVLVVIADLTSYCEAVREVSGARGEVPSRRGYPGYLYSDLASLYERAGRIEGRAGLADADAGADDAGRRHHASRARPDRLHHRGPDRPLAGPARPRRLPAVRRARLALAADAARRRAGAHARRPPRDRRPALRVRRRGAADRRPRRRRRRGRTDAARPSPARASTTRS